MDNILKQACEEIQSEVSVVKIAGILDRLHSWYKNLFDPEYKELVNKLRDDSDQVKEKIQSLYRHITKIDEAIKNGDVGSYDYALEYIRTISHELVESLNKLTVETSAVQEKAGPDVGNYKKINVSENVKRNEQVRITAALKKANVSEGIIAQINFDDLFNTITNALLRGKILESGLAKEQGKERNGELWVSLESPEFKIPGFSYLMQVKATVTDLFVRSYNPKNEASLRNIYWFRVTPMQGTREVEKTASQVNKQINKISGVDLAKVIFQAYQSLGVSNPTPELVGSTWAQIALESGRNGDTINLMNNNFGNVTAGNFDKKWNDKGWVESDKDYVLLKSGLKFKSFPTPLEGAKEYIKTMIYLYPDSLKLKNSGDTMGDAEYLHTKNYYGKVSPEKYGGPMGSLLKEFITNIYPKIVGNSVQPHIQSHIQEAPKAQPHQEHNSMENEIQGLAQYLGISLASEGNLTGIVINAISKEILPKNNILVKVNSSDIETGVFCATSISNSLSKLIQAETSIHSSNNEIEISCAIPGET